jgi:hypothetical protein
MNLHDIIKSYKRKKDVNNSSLDSEKLDEDVESNSNTLSKKRNDFLNYYEKNSLDVNKIDIIKNEFQNRGKGTSKFSEIPQKVDWNLFYKKLSKNDLDMNTIHKKEIELRINSVLNNLNKIGANHNFSKEKPLENNLHLENKYIDDKTNKFVSLVISKFNEYQEKNKNEPIKKLKKRTPTRNKKIAAFSNNCTKDTSISSPPRLVNNININMNENVNGRKSILSPQELKIKTKLLFANDFQFQNPQLDNKADLNVNNQVISSRNSSKYSQHSSKNLNNDENSGIKFYENSKGGIKFENLVRPNEIEHKNRINLIIFLIIF